MARRPSARSRCGSRRRTARRCRRAGRSRERGADGHLRAADDCRAFERRDPRTRGARLRARLQGVRRDQLRAGAVPPGRRVRPLGGDCAVGSAVGARRRRRDRRRRRARARRRAPGPAAARRPADHLRDHGHGRSRLRARRCRPLDLGAERERLPRVHSLRQRQRPRDRDRTEPPLGDRPRRGRARRLRAVLPALQARHRDARSRRRPAGGALDGDQRQPHHRARVGARRRHRGRRGDADREPHRGLARPCLVRAARLPGRDPRRAGLGSRCGRRRRRHRPAAAVQRLLPRPATLQGQHHRHAGARAVRRARAHPPRQALRPVRPGANRARLMSAITTGVYHRSYRADLALRHTLTEYVRLALVLAAVVAAPFVASPYWVHVLDDIGIAVIGAIGLNILVGYTGQISLGQGGFLAVGAYTAGLISIHTSVPPLVGIFLAGLVSAAIGAFFGLPALRLKGLYLAIATLASQVIIQWAIIHWSFLGAAEPLVISEPSRIFGWTPSSDAQWYWVIAAFAVLAAIVATNLFRTGVGRAFVAIRDQDVAAEAIGVNTSRYKILAFAISTGFAGVAGALTAYWTTILTFERFTIDVSILYLAMIIIALPAGLQQLSNELHGSLGFIQANLPAIQQVIFGLSIMLFLVFEPKGLARIWQRAKDYFRLWPFRY